MSFLRNLWWVVPVAVFFLNPTFACSDEPQFQYGADEMRAAVEGDWLFTITLESGPMQVAVYIEQAPGSPAATARAPGRAMVRAAHACGTRTLVKSAGACSDDSQMPLAVSYVLGDAYFSDAALSGTFTVHGLAFTTGVLNLTLGSYQIRSEVHADGTLGARPN